MPEGLTLTKAERVGVAKWMRHKGHPLKEIAAELGIAVSTACQYLTDPTLEGPRQRYNAKAGKGGPCACGCGQRVRGSVSTQSFKYVNGGHARRQTPDQYHIEDRGHTSPCWIWQWRKGPGGYGITLHNGRDTLAHRVYYAQHIGPIPAGHQVDHLCRVRDCVNPAHLEAVTPAENTRRRSGVKLTMDLAREIREADGSNAELAKRYGVSKSTIGFVRAGRTWKEEALHA